MSTITFADVAHPSLSFSSDREPHALVLALIDTPWVQRLRDISQTANARLVYMFSEHSRFGHSVGVAHLADLLMEKLSHNFPEQVQRYRNAVSAAAMLHDIGHLAPGSHTAFKAWFPGKPDLHEELSARVISDDHTIQSILCKNSPDLSAQVLAILSEDAMLPAWTWQILSGGGWNVDRGNWCIVDSVMSGVSYGKYNIPALTDSIVITDDGHLALQENRLDAMMHFAVSRQAMYRQIYQHRVIQAAEMLNRAIVQRARDLGSALEFADPYMRQALDAASAHDIPLTSIFMMRESWWRYHLLRWMQAKDPILADLSTRLINRRLLKTVRVPEQEALAGLQSEAHQALQKAGYDPTYYLYTVTTSDMHASDYAQSMQVVLDDGRIKSLIEADPLFGSLVRESKNVQRTWLVMPEEAKRLLGRQR